MTADVDGRDSETGGRAIDIHRQDFTVKILFVVVVLLLAGLAGVVWQTFAEYNPFCEFPEQTVITRISGIDGPAAYADSAVWVRGTKCYTEDVTIQGTLTYQSVAPRGSIIDVGTGVRDLTTGIFTEVFVNTIPEEVQAKNAVLAEECDCVPVWRITGRETPVDGGATQTFQTEPFQMLPR